MLSSRFIFCIFVSFFSAHILYFVFGWFFYSLGLHELGHRLIAMSIAGDFGLNKRIRRWLVNHCPYNCEICDNCKIWTCGGFKR